MFTRNLLSLEEFLPVEGVTFEHDDAPDENEAFTVGDCWRLALALRKLYGYKIAFYGYKPESFATKPGTFGWMHTFVALDDDAFLDINGISTAEEMDAIWKEQFIGNVECSIFIPESDDVIYECLKHQTPSFPIDALEAAKALHDRVFN